MTYVETALLQLKSDKYIFTINVKYNVFHRMIYLTQIPVSLYFRMSIYYSSKDWCITVVIKMYFKIETFVNLAIFKHTKYAINGLRVCSQIKICVHSLEQVCSLAGMCVHSLEQVCSLAGISHGARKSLRLLLIVPCLELQVVPPVNRHRSLVE